MRLPKLPVETASLLAMPSPLRAPVLAAERPKRTLIWDVERAPIRSLHYDVWQVNISRVGIEQEPFVYCFAAKWADSDEMEFHAVWHEAQSDHNSRVATYAWYLLDEADVVISFNGKRADTRWINDDFSRHGFHQPSQYREIDLFQLGKKHLGIPFKGLNDMCKHFGVQQKLNTGMHAIELYRRAVEQGDPIARGTAEAYNKQDVVATEDLWRIMKERGWT